MTFFSKWSDVLCKDTHQGSVPFPSKRVQMLLPVTLAGTEPLYISLMSPTRSVLSVLRLWQRSINGVMWVQITLTFQLFKHNLLYFGLLCYSWALLSSVRYLCLLFWFVPVCFPLCLPSPALLPSLVNTRLRPDALHLWLIVSAHLLYKSTWLPAPCCQLVVTHMPVSFRHRRELQ